VTQTAGRGGRLQGAVQRWRHDRWVPDLAALPPGKRLGIRLLRFLVVLGSDAQRSDLGLRATALVYATLLSLVPFLAVTFSVLKAFGIHQQLAPALDRALAPLGDQGQLISRQTVAFVDNLKVGVLGVLGVVGLFVTVILLLGKVEDAFNHIWRVRRPRSWGRQFTDYLSVILVGPVLVFAALGLTASARASWVMGRILALGSIGRVILLLGGRVLPVLILAIAFTVVYRFMPHTHVPTTSAFVGGAVAAGLWQLASVVFTAFVARSPRYAAIYSGFAILVLFLIWVEYAWLIVLVGAEVAYLHQHPASYENLVHGQTGLHRLRERLALDALTAIVRRHVAGERPWRVPELTQALRVPPPPVEDLVEELVRRGVLLRAAEPVGVALARAPETVTIAEVLDAVGGVQADGPTSVEGDRAGQLLARRDEAIRTALDGLTLRDLIS